MTPKEEINRLLTRSWSSYAELYGAIRKVIGTEFRFDCFEEWKPGQVCIRSNPVGKPDESFDLQVLLQTEVLAA